LAKEVYLKIGHLKYVLEVDRTGSISQAADNLYIRQPNLSKAIKELEQTLNIIIFERTPKGVRITPKGREFLRYARGILRQYEEMEALGQKDTEDVQSLRISMPRASYIVDALTTLLAGLDNEKPLQMDFFETNALRTIRHVSDQIFDFGIIRCKAEYQNYFTSLLDDDGLRWRPLLAFEYLLLISKNHPLSRKGEIHTQDLHPYIEIIHGDAAVPQMANNVTETERGVTPGDKKVKIYGRGSQFDILSRVPSAYMWVSPLPQDLLDRSGLKQRRCMESPKFIDIFINRDNHTFSPIETKFLDLLNESVKNILSLDMLYQ
jgi:DNA-binding transcriptional LysR family regulator